MRIGFFTDTYRPTINGITYVVDTVKYQLEAAGHEVFVFCPAKTISPSKIAEMTVEDCNIFRIPSFSSGFFDDFDFALFFPPRILRQIEEMDLDIIHVFTPSQIGMLGVHAATKHHIPFVVQHSTDLYEFIENYPNVLPGALALLNIVLPMSVKVDKRDIIEMMKLQRPRFGATKWGRDIIERALTMVYSKADAVIALSRKSKRQLNSWQDEDYHYDLTLLPNGVDAIPRPSPSRLAAFREQWGLRERDEVFGFVGRLGEEKNLALLIEAMDIVGAARPKAKLLFVGDFDYRKTLEAMAAASRYPDRIVFTGALPREELGVVYAALDVFTFPSLKDTQGWVLHEAAHANLPIVLIDRDLSEVMIDGENGFFAENTSESVAEQVIALLRSPTLRAKFGTRSKQLASRFTEKNQTKKLIKLYERILAEHTQDPLDDTHGSRRLVQALKHAREAIGRYYQ